jgi:hypothetical protein
MAVEVLKSRGVPEDHILFLNLIASPEGVENFATKFPRLKVVTAFIDEVSTPRVLLIMCQIFDKDFRDWMTKSMLAVITNGHR